MNNNKKVLNLRQEILQANTKLEQIKNSGMLEDSAEVNSRYNKILIQKAIYRKELLENSQSLVKKLFKKLFQQNRSEKLICDYFKS